MPFYFNPFIASDRSALTLITAAAGAWGFTTDDERLYVYDGNEWIEMEGHYVVTARQLGDAIEHGLTEDRFEDLDSYAMAQALLDMIEEEHDARLGSSDRGQGAGAPPSPGGDGGGASGRAGASEGGSVHGDPSQHDQRPPS